MPDDESVDLEQTRRQAVAAERGAKLMDHRDALAGPLYHLDASYRPGHRTDLREREKGRDGGRPGQPLLVIPA